MKKALATCVAVTALAVGACSSSSPVSGGTAGGVAAGTATEQKLCADLNAGASTKILYDDANAVNNDLSTGPDDMSLEVLAYISAVDKLPGAASIKAEVARLKDLCQNMAG